ncbi:MAG TPA: hypothetical protein VMX97_01820, partial [Hyphomicrobiaceae bacterium]|nr:hypothetical protein [Hyphomicrobiaceae bacterium]
STGSLSKLNISCDGDSRQNLPGSAKPTLEINGLRGILGAPPRHPLPWHILDNSAPSAFLKPIQCGLAEVSCLRSKPHDQHA